MELLKDNSIKPIAFYLPQFHCIPENDNAYGKGFTEWTNVKKAQPLFEGHNQPRVPYGDNYYNILDPDIMVEQAKTAKKYGIYGFCYYHYWFSGGKKLLEKPIENMLQNKDIDIPFCLCWANENWSKRWDGGNNEVIVAQDYGDLDDWRKHIQYLISFFKDERYIRISDQPLLLIYKPDIIPDCSKFVSILRNEMKKQGFKGIKIAVQYPNYYLNEFDKSLFDYYVDFEPAFTRVEEEINNQSKIVRKVYKLTRGLPIKKVLSRVYNLVSPPNTANKLSIRDYDNDWRKILTRNYNDPKLIPGGFVDWDNTPRNKHGLTYKGVEPKKFRYYFYKLCKKVYLRPEKCVFINAWNEWAEGAYLEPDKKNGYAYLNAIKEVVDKYGSWYNKKDIT